MTPNYPSYWNESADFQRLEESYRIKIQSFFLHDRNSYSVDPVDVFAALKKGVKYDYVSSHEDLKELNSTIDIKAVIAYKLPYGGWECIKQLDEFLEPLLELLDEDCHLTFIWHEAGEHYKDPQEEWFIVIS